MNSIVSSPCEAHPYNKNFKIDKVIVRPQSRINISIFHRTIICIMENCCIHVETIVLQEATKEGVSYCLIRCITLLYNIVEYHLSPITYKLLGIFLHTIISPCALKGLKRPDQNCLQKSLNARCCKYNIDDVINVCFSVVGPVDKEGPFRCLYNGLTIRKHT